MVLNTLIFFAALFINSIVGFDNLGEGDACKPTLNILEGICKVATDCEDAMRYISNRDPHPFKSCGFIGKLEIVCCPKTSHPVPTTRKPITTKNPISRFGVNDAVRVAAKKCKEIVSNTIPPQDVHIIGGEDANQGEFPHMAALGFLKDGVYDFVCGGSLISQYYILTAAHCVDNIDQISPSIARLGVAEIGKNVFNPETDIRISDIIIHPTRTTSDKYHDLALLRLAQPAQYSLYVAPACLYTDETIPSNVALTVTGWGIISSDKDIRSTVLQKANVSQVANAECGENYKGWRKLPNGIGQGQICAGHPQGRTDTCKGDSGGPLQGLTSNDGYYRLIAITSFGRGCGSSIPAVYTRVFSYLDWIENIVWPNGA